MNKKIIISLVVIGVSLGISMIYNLSTTKDDVFVETSTKEFNKDKTNYSIVIDDPVTNSGSV